MKLKEKYSLAKCCAPSVNSKIVGYFSHDNLIKIHNNSCPNIKNVESERLLFLKWDDILADKYEFKPDVNYYKLDQIDFAILKHHLDFGVDYSLVVARQVNISKQEAFDCHKKLKELKLLERVQKLMIQYRKGIVDNKWIKHRNHTYYQLTELGKNYINYYLSNK